MLQLCTVFKQQKGVYNFYICFKSNHQLMHPFELRGKSAILHFPKTLPCLCAGKAPPNLSQGVPPLLPNQYIMGPGGLLPAYPVRTFLLLNQ